MTEKEKMNYKEIVAEFTKKRCPLCIHNNKCEGPGFREYGDGTYIIPNGDFECFVVKHQKFHCCAYTGKYEQYKDKKVVVCGREYMYITSYDFVDKKTRTFSKKIFLLDYDKLPNKHEDFIIKVDSADNKQSVIQNYIMIFDRYLKEV